MAELKALAHGLKGAGGSMGFDQMFEPAKALEAAATEGQAELVDAAIAELQRIGRAIQRGMPMTQNNLAETAA
jgi:HPt (histidine-containing phosphotransfer) domain-containing protein